MSHNHKIRRKVVRIAAVIGVLLLLCISFYFYSIILPTPKVDERVSPSNYKRIEVAKNHYKVGNNWLKKNQLGIWEMYLEGSAYERGVIYGVLAKELIKKQEVHFVKQLNEIVPNAIYIQFLKYLVAWFNKDLPKYIPEEFLQEIYGVSQSFSDDYDYIGPKYYRILNYHAAHDIGHALNDFNLVGCTSFAVNNEASADGELLIGRNFDFYMGEGFAEDKLILFMNPDSGYAFSSYSWAGLMGVVSGMNEMGLTVTINAAKSDVPLGTKDPISLLVREILQYAQNIDEAVSIAKKRDVFVSESLLIGSAADGKAVIIEKSPTKMDVYDPNKTILQCTNHYQSNLFSKDSANIQNIKESDSKERYNRLSELLLSQKTIDVATAVSILRDKNGIENKDIGLGNPKAINQLIAHHAIIFQPEKQLFWVSSSPYQLGEFQCYRLNKSASSDYQFSIDSLNIPADSFLLSLAYTKYQYYKRIKESISKNVLLGVPYELTTSTVDKFIDSNPNSYIVYMLLGEYYLKNNQKEKAKKYFQKALTCEIASKQEEDKIKEGIQRIEN